MDNPPAQPNAQPDAFDLRRLEKRARWQERRNELRQLRKAKETERGRELVHIEKKRHEQEYARRCRRERYLLRRQQENPLPEPPTDILFWPPSMFRPKPEVIRARAQFHARRRRLRNVRGRPPLRELPCRSPSRDELLSLAISILYEHGRPNRNLLRTVRWMHGDLPDSALPEKIRAKHRPAAGEVCRRAWEELSTRLRADSISCRRGLRRWRILSQNRNYRWTRFPAAGIAGLDNLGRPADQPAQMYDPLLGLDVIHPRLVGFGPDSSGCSCTESPPARRVFGLENVFRPFGGFWGAAGGAGGIAPCKRNKRNKINSGRPVAEPPAITLPGLRPLRRGFVFPLRIRRRYVLPVCSAGPPVVILFPPGGEREILLCFPGGGLLVAALCSLTRPDAPPKQSPNQVL